MAMEKTLSRCSAVSPQPKFGGYFHRLPLVPTLALLGSSSVRSGFTLTSLCRPLRAAETKTNKAIDREQGFSVLKLDSPWERGSLWSTMSLYMFGLHIPLSFGGLSIVAYALRESSLDPRTEVLSLLVLEAMELVGVLSLLKGSLRSQQELMTLYENHASSTGRSWILATSVGFGVLIVLLSLTAILADQLWGPKDVNNPVLREILVSDNVSKVACFLLYCIIAPLLEETVYRGFLLTSLASTMNWKVAVLLSAAIFSTAHFSAENFIQLFIIGCALGCSYCWTGNLFSSIALHSLYNAFTLVITLLS